MPTAVHTPESEALAVVVLGAFNPTILHPQWFLRHEMIGEEEAGNARIKAMVTELADVSFGGVDLQCVASRLVLQTSNVSYATKLFDIVQGILRLLPYTPVRACGINPTAHYRVDHVDYWHKIGHTLAPKTPIWNALLTEPGLQTLTIKSKREGAFPGELNVTVEPSQRITPGIHVRANTHYDISGAAHDTGETETIREFLTQEWRNACMQARRVCDKIFEEVKPDE